MVHFGFDDEELFWVVAEKEMMLVIVHLDGWTVEWVCNGGCGRAFLKEAVGKAVVGVGAVEGA